MKFYLAGPVGYGENGIEWKREIKEYLREKGNVVYDPIENDHKYPLVEKMNIMKSQSKRYFREIKEIMQEIFVDDCEFITNCDYLICYYIGRSYGTISEQGIAYYLNKFLNKKVKTINIFHESFNPDEWVLCCSDYVFFNIEECMNFLKGLSK